jgi:2'-5' RNA ligase
MPEKRQTKRLFVGTFLSQAERSPLDVELHESLSLQWKTKIRKVRIDKLHLTWVFLGDLDSQKEDQTVSALTEAVQGLKPCSLAYTQFELFPSSRHPSLVALTPESIPERASLIDTKLKRSLRSLCVKEERSHFRPHITVMRFPRQSRGRFNIPADFPPEGILPVTHRIDKICLIHSHYDQGQDLYEVLLDLPLME